MRAGSFATQLNKSDIACKVHDWSVGIVYKGATRLSSLAYLEQGIPILDKTNQSIQLVHADA